MRRFGSDDSIFSATNSQQAAFSATYLSDTDLVGGGHPGPTLHILLAPAPNSGNHSFVADGRGRGHDSSSDSQFSVAPGTIVVIGNWRPATGCSGDSTNVSGSDTLRAAAASRIEVLYPASSSEIASAFTIAVAAN
jgi:hypothetical protein